MSGRVLAGASVGLLAGLGVVSSTAVVTERCNAAPEYSSSVRRFGQGTFGGRLATMLSTMNPTTLLASDGDVVAAAGLIAAFDAQQQAPAAGYRKPSNSELWAARQLRDSAMHPDTGELIPRPFRMSGYVPFNGPVCVAMMLAASTPSLLFWNWVNQSQNALVNYFNRNASSPTSNEILVRSYATAVSCALAVAFGISQFIQRRYDVATATKLMKFVALPSSMIASSANAYIMRSPEIDTGVSVYDADLKREVGTGLRSNIAAKKAVMETVYSRILLQVPTFFIPPLCMMIPPIAALAAANPVFNMAASTFVLLVGFGLGLPAAVAVFPQTGSLGVNELEPELRQAAQSMGLQRVYFNKGL